MKYDAIIVASGKGLRANLGYNKILYKLKNGRTVIEESCHLFVDDKDCNSIIIVTEEKLPFINEKVKITNGGKERSDSVMNGLELVTSEYVLIHDGARPFLNLEDLNRVKEAVYEYGAALLAKKAVDTIKYEEDGFVKETIDRKYIWQAQTPQGFKTSLIKEAYRNIKDNVTDDASVVEMYGHKVKLVEGNTSNIKLTTHEDFNNI